MAVDSKENVSGGSDEGKGAVWLDPDLVSAYLELQVQWLRLQVANAQMQAAASELDANLEATTARLWRKAAPTAIIVALVALVVTVVAAATWDDLWRGLTYGSTPTLQITRTQKEGLAQGMTALSSFLMEWKDVIFGILGGGALIAFKRLAYRSVGSALVIVLGVALSASLLFMLVIADLNWVNLDPTPEQVALKGWGVVALAAVVGLVLMVELGDFAIGAGPAAFVSRSQWYHHLGQWVAWFSTETWPGRFLTWLVTPNGWRHRFAALGILMATSVVLCGVALVAATAANSSNVFWELLFFVAVPLGPLWWLWLLGTLFRSGTDWRHPTRGPVRMAIFAVAPIVSLVAFVGCFLSPASYLPDQSTGIGAALIGVAAIVVWAVWFVWAAIALPASLRITYLPLVVAFYLGGFGPHETLAFMGLGVVVAVGVPISLWRSSPRAAASAQPASGDHAVNPTPVGAD